MYVAVIVETRNHPALQFVINQALQVLPKEWVVQIFHGPNVHVEDSDRVVLTPMPETNLTVGQYSQKLMSREFWQQVQGEHILVFQCDTVLLTNSANKIADFLQYNYVGAPWRWKNGKVGNGGLSLRRKSAVLDVLDRVDRSRPEDVAFSNVIGNVAPLHIARMFSVESMFHPSPVGVHKPWKHLSSRELEELETKHPEIRKMRILNGIRAPKPSKSRSTPRSRSIPRSPPRYVPRSTHQSIPRSIPQSIPRSRSIPRSVHHSAPRRVLHSIPRSTQHLTTNPPGPGHLSRPRWLMRRVERIRRVKPQNITK